MKTLRKVIVITTALAMLLSLAACGSTNTQQSGAEDSAVTAEAVTRDAPVKDIEKDNIVIEYIPMSTAMENTPVIVDGIKSAISEYPNVTLNVLDAQFDINQEINLVQEAITQGVDGLILQCGDGVAMNAVIEEAEAAGIVVMVMNLPNTSVCSGYICNADYSCGRMGAEYLHQLTGGEGKIIVLDVSTELVDTCINGRGFEDYIEENCHFEVLEWINQMTLVEEAYNTMRDLLTKYDDIDAIWCANDNQAIGAYQAIVESGREDDGIIIIGCEGAPMGLAAVKDGKIAATVGADPFYEGFTETVMLMNYIQMGINSHELGLKYIPKYQLPMTLITPENVDEVMAGSHWDRSAYG